MATLDGKIDSMFSEAFTRLRETERLTSEQGVRIEALTARIDNLATATDKFISHLARQEERSEKREQNFFKAISVLIGALVALALGPKVAKELYSSLTGNQTAAVSPCVILHPDNKNRWAVA